MKKEPSDQTLTKIDAVILRAVEMDREINYSDLEEFILKEYGYDVSVKERLKEYTPRDDDNNFICWN